MKNLHLRPSLFILMLLFGSSLSCNTKFHLPLLYGNDSVRTLMSEASNKILATLPDIADRVNKVSVPRDDPLRKALSVVFKFLKDDNAKGLIDARIESKRAEDAIKQLNVNMFKVEKILSSIFSSNLSLVVKIQDLITICERVFPFFSDGKSAFNEAKLATSPHYVAFATVYLTIAQLGKAFNPQDIPKLKEQMRSLLDNLAEFEFDVKPQRKVMLQQIIPCNGSPGVCFYDEMSGEEFNDVSCRSEWSQEITKRIKKLFSPVKERIAAFLGVSIPVKYQYYTSRGGECFDSCSYHGGTAFTWCRSLEAGLGNDWGTCSVENDVTSKGEKCVNKCARHRGVDAILPVLLSGTIALL